MKDIWYVITFYCKDARASVVWLFECCVEHSVVFNVEQFVTEVLHEVDVQLNE